MPDPFKLALPDGTEVELPADLPVSERNRLIQDLLVQKGFIEEPRMIRIPLAAKGMTEPYKIKESTARTLTNIPGEMAASTGLGLLGGAVPGVGGVLGPVGRALGAPLGRKLISEPLQKALGVRSEPMGIEGAIGLAGLTGAGELAGSLASKGIRSGLGVLGRAPGKATAEETRYLTKLYREAGIDPPTPSSILQSKGIQGAFGYAQKSIYSAGVTDDFLQRQEANTLNAILGRTAKPGSATRGYTAQEVGDVLRTGPRRAQAEFQRDARTLFNRARSMRPPGLTVKLGTTMDQLDSVLYEHVVEIASAAGGTKISRIARNVQKAVAEGKPIQFEDLERLRSFVGRQIAKTVGPERGELKTFFGRLTDDMELALEKSPDITDDAVGAWRAARNHYREGIKTIDDFYAKINKKVTPEEVTYELERYITGDKPNMTRLGEIRATLTDDEWAPFEDWFIRKNLVSGDGKTFLGLGQFLAKAKNWDDEMMDLVFGANTPKRRWMENLKDIARNEEIYGSGGVQRNPLMVASEIVAPVAGTVGAIATNASPFLTIVTAGAYPLGMNRLGHLLTSETMLRWVAEGAKMHPNGWAAHIGALAGIAANEDPENQESIVELIQNMRSAASEPGPRRLPGFGLLGR